MAPYVDYKIRSDDMLDTLICRDFGIPNYSELLSVIPIPKSREF